MEFTEIEKLYSKKKNIDVKNININDKFKITENAYKWAHKYRKYFIGDLKNNKKHFIGFLEGQMC